MAVNELSLNRPFNRNQKFVGSAPWTSIRSFRHHKPVRAGSVVLPIKHQTAEPGSGKTTSRFHKRCSVAYEWTVWVKGGVRKRVVGLSSRLVRARVKSIDTFPEDQSRAREPLPQEIEIMETGVFSEWFARCYRALIGTQDRPLSRGDRKRDQLISYLGLDGAAGFHAR